MFGRAIDHLSTAVSLRPNEPQAHYNLALAYIEAEQLGRAEAALNDLVKIDSRFWAAYHRLGEVYIARDEPDSARAVLERLLEANPEYSQRPAVEDILENL